MSRYRHLPIWKAAMDLAVHLEHAVRRFPRYHKYTLGSELRQTAQRVCRLVARANDARAELRVLALDDLVLSVEEMKTLLTLAQEVKAFANFNEFAGAAELTVSLGKQSGGWRRRVRPEASSQTSVRG
jgi:lipid-binding SYLF domain-containing protein